MKDIVSSDFLASYVPTSTYTEEHPLAALSKNNPNGATQIMNRMVKLEERKASLETMRGVVTDQANNISTWLGNRQPGEKNIEVEHHSAQDNSGTFFCGNRTKLYAKTRIKIW